MTNRYERIEHYSDLGLGTDEPSIHRFTRAVERAELQALEEHNSGRCADSEWSCSHCEQEETLAPAATGDEGEKSIHSKGKIHD